MSEEWKTRQSLLVRAKNPGDEEAWSVFVKYYERFIYYLLNRMKISTNDCDDLFQVVLVKLWKSMESYDRTKSQFRTWLAHVVRNAVYDYFKAEGRRSKVIGNESLLEDILESETESELEKTIEKEWKLYMTNFAMERLRGIFTETALGVFELSLEGVPVPEIARRLGIGVDTVYTLKNRVKARFIKEVHAVMQEVEF